MELPETKDPDILYMLAIEKASQHPFFGTIVPFS
jgi:hypothetical protein